jgi:histidine triad (HIT) family protein
MKDCIFCKIIKGEIPSYTIYEDDIVKVFLDANPDDNGHMLIVPKKHITDFTELDNETLSHINDVLKNKLKPLIYEKLNPKGLRIVNNYGIYQFVKHYHLHVIPCYEPKENLISTEDIFNKLTK